MSESAAHEILRRCLTDVTDFRIVFMTGGGPPVTMLMSYVQTIESGTWAECPHPRDPRISIVMVATANRRIYMGAIRGVVRPSDLLDAIRMLAGRKVSATAIPIHADEHIARDTGQGPTLLRYLTDHTLYLPISASAPPGRMARAD